MSVIHATGAACGAASGSSSTALNSQPQRLQRQYADWQHCPSASTPEGKARVEALASDLAATRAALDNMTGASARGLPARWAQAAPVASTPAGRIDLYA